MFGVLWFVGAAAFGQDQRGEEPAAPAPDLPQEPAPDPAAPVEPAIVVEPAVTAEPAAMPGAAEPADPAGITNTSGKLMTVREASRPVGGSMAGWGAVPIASEGERQRGLTHLWGQLQVWTTAWDQDVEAQADPATYGDPEADPGFSIRRARLGIDGFVPMGDLGGKSQIDYALSVGIGAPYDALGDATEDVEIVDAFGRWALPTKLGVTSLALGLQRVPFSRESMMSSADLVFQEVAVGTNWLTPSREVGATASQSIQFTNDPAGPQILVRVGGYNGGGDLYGASGRGMLAAARAEIVVGDPYRTWSADRDSALGLGAALLRDDDLSTRTDALAADLIARYSVVTAMAEVVTSTIEPTNTTIADPDVVVETGRLGLLGQISLWIPLQEDRGVEVAARYATFDDDDGLQNNGNVGILHAGATWRNLAPRVDLGAGYVHRTEVAGVPNDTVRVWTQIRPQAKVF